LRLINIAGKNAPSGGARGVAALMPGQARAPRANAIGSDARMTDATARGAAGEPDKPARCRVGPRFTAEEKWAIARWSAAMRPLGLSIDFAADHPFLREALHIKPELAEEPLWLLHKTPEGLCAVRQWPGLADVVATVEQALAIVAETMAGGSTVSTA